MITGEVQDVPGGKIAVVVTHLEMTERAATRDLPLPEGVSFRAVEPDVAWYRDVFDRVGSDWLWFGRRTLSDDALMEIISDKDVALYTLNRGGVDEALLELDFRQPGECELAYFGLGKALIGTGAGRALMDRAITHAWERDISRFHVHTCTNDSPQALTFYIRSGFTPFKRQVEIEDDPRLKGLLPENVAPHLPVIR